MIRKIADGRMEPAPGEVRAALYQTYLTVVVRIGSSRVDGRGAGVSACFVVSSCVIVAEVAD